MSAREQTLRIQVEHVPAAQSPGERQYRLWIVDRPANWLGLFNERPPRATAIGLAAEGSYPLPTALAMLLAFNSQAERRLDGLWMVAQPVRIVYGGDCVPGSFID